MVKIDIVTGDGRVIPCRLDPSKGDPAIVKLRHRATVVDAAFLETLALKGGWVETDDPGLVVKACALPLGHPGIAIVRHPPQWGEMIKKAIADAGITRREAAERAGVPLRTLEDWIGGQFSPRRSSAVAALERLTGHPLDGKAFSALEWSADEPK